MKRSILFILLFLCISACASAGSDGSSQEMQIKTTKIEVIEPEESIFDKTLSTKQEYLQIDRSFMNSSAGQTVSGDLSYEDFSFYAELLEIGVPDDAFWPAIREMDGPWRYMLQIGEDPEIDKNYFDELGYADFVIDYDREIIILTLHPRLASDGYAVYEESDADVGYLPFEGEPEGGGIKLIGNDCVLWISDYYASEGREYVLAQMYLSEEDHALFLMTRGQD